jgi:adapter protein MecA 1/2
VNGLINSIPQQKWEEIQEAKRAGMEREDVRVLITLVFAEMDVLIRFAKQVSLQPLPPSALYKQNDQYMLLMNLSQMDESDVRRLSTLTDEFASDIFVGAERMSFIEEHGEAIMRENALEMLREL